jgi:glycosyltransferase involved in cell wall biosynthesis
MRIVEPISPAARISYGLREAARAIRHAPGRAAFARRLARVQKAGPDEILVNYGWLDDPARPEETRIGGGVKLDHLRGRFGESRDVFSVLYLVSSLLHLIPYAQDLVRHCRRVGIKVVWNQNGVAYPAWRGDFYPWFNKPMRRLIARADHVIYQSRFCRQSADRYLGSIGAPHEVLWNPVDIERFSPASEPPPAEPWQLLAMGTCHAFYRVKASIDCLAHLSREGRKARLTIAGELRWPGAAAEVRGYVRERGFADRVEFLPRFPQAQAPAIYRRAHVLIHPKYKDPCPTVPIEAMACGVPVAGSRSGGMPELVPARAGELISVPDDWTRDHEPRVREMADAVTRIMLTHGVYASGAREHAVEAFDSRRWVDRHEAVFHRLIDRE